MPSDITLPSHCECMVRASRQTLLGDPHCRRCGGEGVVRRPVTQQTLSAQLREDGCSAEEIAELLERGAFEEDGHG